MSDEPQASTGKGPRRAVFGCLALVLAPGILVAACTAFFALTGDRGDSPESLDYEARTYCEDAVSERLKSPTTAEHESEAAGTGTTRTVTGVVDSQNSFGATIRSEYRCTVEFDGDNQTTRVDYLR